MEEIVFDGYDGATVDALWGAPHRPAIGGILFCHSATSNNRSFLPEAEELIAAGFACIIPNAPWMRQGSHYIAREVSRPSKPFRQMVLDFAIASEELKRRANFGAGKLAIVGRNVGGALSGAIAERNPDVIGVVGIACLTRMSNFWQHSNHPIAVKQRDKYGTDQIHNAWSPLADMDLISAGKRTQCDYFLQVGHEDKWISRQEIEAFNSALGERAQIKWYEDGHDMLIKTAQEDRLLWLQNILET